MFPQSVRARLTPDGDPYPVREAGSKVGSVSTLVFRRRARRLDRGCTQLIQKMPRQPLADAGVLAIVDFGDFGDGAAAARCHRDETGGAAAVRPPVAAGGVANGIAARNHPFAVLGRTTIRSMDAGIGIIEPDGLEEFHVRNRFAKDIYNESLPHCGLETPRERDMAEPELPKDFFEFMQKMWNPLSFPMPGMLTPTVSVEEIDKKIAELKAVETWLTMNVGFVQMTVKTLEMQKAALESLQAAAGRPAG